jgi:integrase
VGTLRKDGLWQVSHGTGRNRIYFRAKTLEEAEAKKQAHLAQYLPLPPGCVSEFVELAWFPGKKLVCEVSTLRRYADAYRLNIEPRIGMMDIRAVSLECLLPIFGDLNGENYRMVRSVLVSIFELAYQLGRVDRNPAKMVPNVPKVVKPKTNFTLERAAKIEAAFKGTPIELQVWLALRLGLRRGEVLGLKATDLNVKELTVTIARQRSREEGEKKTKTGKVREVPITREMMEHIRSYIQPGQIYLSTMTPNRFSKCFDRISAKENLGVTFHDLRAFCSSNMIRLTKEPHTTRKVIGHGSERMTEVYFDEHRESMREAVDTLDRAYRRTSTDDAVNPEGVE